MWAAFRRSQSAILGLLGLIIVSVFLILAAIGPWIVPFPEAAYCAVHFERKLQAPSSTHWFGKDEVGLDIFACVIIGARTTLWICLTVTGIAVLIGGAFRASAGCVVWFLHSA